MPSPRQTASFLMQRFAEVGIHPATRRGQNFLIDLNLVELLVETAAVTPDDVVLEIGTGTGSLTALLARTAAVVVTVEIDPHLHQLAREALVDCPNVVMLQQDALKNKNHLHPAVLDAVREQLAAAPGRRLKLAANLPYNVATPVISNLLGLDEPPVSLTVTIQRELGERIAAAPAQQGLRGVERVGAVPVPDGSGADPAAQRVLAAAADRVGDRADRRRAGAAGADSRTGRFSTASCVRCSSTAASCSATNCSARSPPPWTSRRSMLS